MKDKSQLGGLTIDIPATLVVPQLSRGKIEIRLGELHSLLPKDAVQGQIPAAFAQQTIVLPLAEVIAAIPAEALAPQHEAVISMDTPEFKQLPSLFDDSMTEEPRALETVESPIVEEVFAEKTAGEVVAATSVTATATATLEPPVTAAPAHPALVSDVPEHVMISLRSLVSVMPDNVFSSPRSELWRKVDFDLPVLLPVQPMLPQLRSARVRLPLATVIEVIPHSLLADPLPNIDDETVSIPIGEIVTQLPPRLFTNGLRDAEQQIKVSEEEIPNPFAEKAPATATTEPEPAVPVHEIDEEETLVVEPQPSESFAGSEAFEDEDFAVFAERAPAAPPPIAPVAPPAPIAPVAPVAPPPAPELVAETPVPVAPAEPISSAPETTQECVTEITGLDENRFLIDLNRCTAEDLQQLEGIGSALAHRIIEFRNARGQFTSINELRHIPGIGGKTFRALAGVEPRALNRLLGAPHDEELTLQEIVRLTGQLPGVEGCMLAMSDGVFLTGQLPERLDQNSVSVFAPQLFKKVGRYMRELRVGQIRRLTIFTDQQPLSIFRAGEVYLIVVHDLSHFSKALLRRCERISEEIARLCRQRAVV